MKEKITIGGRSLIFNISFVILNLIGLAFLAMAYHKSFEEQAALFKVMGWILLMATIGGMIIFRGRFLMSSVARVLVGGLFIVSGLVKANDPIGFSYKLEEYFEDGALAFRIKEWFSAPGFSMEFFIDYALLLSVLICIAEIVLGILVIIGGKIKLVSYLMLFMMIFFTFLTWHTASCDNEMKFKDHDTYAITDPVAQLKIEEAKTNKEIKVISKTKTEVVIQEMKSPQCVDDCGCFGDAMKGSVGRSLTPKESLWKDIVLVYLVFWIFLAQRIIKPNTRKENIIYSLASIGVVFFFSWVFGWYFPGFFIILSLIGALWIIRAGGKVLGNHYGSALIVAIACTALVTYVLMYNPIKDYRPYAVGSDLKEKMNDGIEGVFVNYYFLTDLEANTTTRVDMNDIAPEVWSSPEKWKYEYDTIESVIEPRNPSIMDFRPVIGIQDLTPYEKELGMVKDVLGSSSVKLLTILALAYNSEMEIPIDEYTPEGFPAEEYTILDTIVSLDPNLTEIDATMAILEEDRVVMLISKNLNEANWSALERLKEIQAECMKKNVPFIMICNSSRESINAFRKKHKFDVPAFVMDEIELKIISRSNPSVVVLEKGVVKGKYAFRSTPNLDDFKNKHLK